MKSNDFDLTVVICCFNSAKYINETLNSLYNQTYKFFKLLIIDDGSTDSSVIVINKYLSEHSSLVASLIPLDKNQGTAYARNLALHTVDTSLMMFFDSDDIAYPEMIQKMYNKIETDEKLIAVGCFCRYMDINSNILSGGLFLGPKTPEEFYEKASTGKLIFMTPPTIFRVFFALEAGGYRQGEGFPQGETRYQDLSEDVDLWGRMSDFYADGKVMLVLPEVLYSYRKNTNSLSAGKKQLFIMSKKLKYIKFNQKLRRLNRKELTFIEYWAQLGFWGKIKLWCSSLSGYYYREAAFSYVRCEYLRAVYSLILSFFLNPYYIFEKYKFNFRKEI